MELNIIDENPLIDNLDKEFYRLEDDLKLFTNVCETVEKEISRVHNIQDKEKILKLSIKFQDLNEIMDKIDSKIKFIQNSINSENSKENQKNNFAKLKNISMTLYSRFEELNGKIYSLIEDAKRRIDNQIGINTRLYLEQDGKNPNDENANYNITNANINITAYSGHKEASASCFDSDKIVTEKVRMNIESLKERKEDLLKIAKLSKQILDFSLDMKISVLRQSGSLNKIEDNIEDTKLTVQNGEDQIHKLDGNLPTFNKGYFWICTILSALVVTCVVYLYLKL